MIEPGSKAASDLLTANPLLNVEKNAFGELPSR